MAHSLNPVDGPEAATFGGETVRPCVLERIWVTQPRLERNDILTESFIRRPGLLRAALAAMLMVALPGCQVLQGALEEPGLKPSSSPVTIDSVSRNNRLARLAREQHPRILATYGGEYSDTKLERTVAKIVGQLTLVSGDPEQTYRITILDSPNVNAFALPGGYLYITRGLLALANDSAELAAVVAHEMAHVTANHGVARQRREAEESLAGRVVADVLRDSSVTRAAVIRGKLRLAQFSRNQELEADAIGIKMIGTAGYDPYAAMRFLRSMTAYSSFRTAAGDPDTNLDFLATHPNPPQRIEQARRNASRFGAPGVGKTDQDAYFNGISGMLFGDKPEEGYVRGRNFMHPELGITFSVPSGFTIDNSANAVTATGPGDIAVRFDSVAVRRGMSLSNYIKSGWVSGLDKESVRAVTINRNEAATARARSDGWQFDITVVRLNGRVYRLLTAAPLSSARLVSVARSVSGSFRALTAREKATLKPLRIKTVKVRAGDTVGTLAARMKGTDRKLDLFRILNALPAGASLSVGKPVKIVTDQ